MMSIRQIRLTKDYKVETCVGGVSTCTARLHVNSSGMFIRSPVLTSPFKHYMLAGHELTFHINKIHATLTS